MPNQFGQSGPIDARAMMAQQLMQTQIDPRSIGGALGGLGSKLVGAMLMKKSMDAQTAKETQRNAALDAFGERHGMPGLSNFGSAAQSTILGSLLKEETPETFGAPVEVVGPGGTLRLVRPGNRGSMQPVEGYSPKPPKDPDILDPRVQDARMRIAQAGKPETTVNFPQNKKFDETMATNYANRLNMFVEQSDDSRRNINNLSLLRNLSNRAPAGPLAGVEASGKRLLSSFGLKPEDLGLDDNVAAADAFNAVANQLTLGSVSQLKGPLSEKELGFLATLNPQLTQTREGRELMISIAERIQKRRLEEANFARRYASKNGGRLDINFEDELANEFGNKPLFDDLLKPGASDLGGMSAAELNAFVQSRGGEAKLTPEEAKAVDARLKALGF